MSAWDRLAGGLVPVLRRHPRAVFAVDGAEYAREIVWLRRGLKFTYSTPKIPRSVRTIRQAEDLRVKEQVRRRFAGEPAVQVGDVIPKYATAFLEQCRIVRDSENTMWKRAEGAERHDTLGSGQEYEWVMWAAGEWSGGWHADDQVMLDEGSPLTVLELISHAAA